MKRSTTIYSTVGTVLLLALTACSEGATGIDDPAYPTRTVSIIVPFDPGGPTDLGARAVAECFDRNLGENVIVENRPGASGVVGNTELANANPDGHTLGVVTVSTGVLAPLFQGDVNYTIDDFTFIGQTQEVPSVIAVAGDSPFDSLEQLLEEAASRPGDITIGVPGSTSVTGIEAERLVASSSTNMTTVPFDGAAPLSNALLGGNVDALFDAATDGLLEQIESGSMRALAIGTPERQDFLEDVPTLRELGYGELVNSATFQTIAAPLNLPADVLDLLESQLAECLDESSVVEQIGVNYVPNEFVGSEGATEMFQELVEIYEEIDF